jgi:hypothetical protein
MYRNEGGRNKRVHEEELIFCFLKITCISSPEKYSEKGTLNTPGEMGGEISCSFTSTKR